MLFGLSRNDGKDKSCRTFNRHARLLNFLEKNVESLRAVVWQFCSPPSFDIVVAGKEKSPTV